MAYRKFSRRSAGAISRDWVKGMGSFYLRFKSKAFNRRGRRDRRDDENQSCLGRSPFAESNSQMPNTLAESSQSFSRRTLRSLRLKAFDFGRRISFRPINLRPLQPI